MVLQQVRSDFEQVILLQKELSAKISLLQKEVQLPKFRHPKKFQRKKRRRSPHLETPFQFP